MYFSQILAGAYILFPVGSILQKSIFIYILFSFF